ncbi:MAG: hypothetical protein HY908_27935 [Myxococcales bacterium]|nr:hypothetical protein [Myxococcales bacterium]
MKYMTLLTSVLALGLAAATTGCNKYGDYCEKWSACVGGNDKDIDKCTEDYEGREGVASAYDCSTEYDAWWECREQNAHCDNANYTTGDNCTAKSQSLDQCEESASGHKSNNGVCQCTCDCGGTQIPTTCAGGGCCFTACTTMSCNFVAQSGC